MPHSPTSAANGRQHTDEPYDLLVLGAGVMGLSVAFEEQQRGKRVAVIDPKPFGADRSRASWAAAGILVTRAGVLGDSAFRNFHLRSVPLYPDWLARVEAAAGMTVPYERGGDYQIFLGDPAHNAETGRILHEREDQLRRERASRFTRLKEWPDFLKPHGASGPVNLYHFPDEAYVNNRMLLQALEAALKRGGATLLPESRATKITRKSTAGGANSVEIESPEGHVSLRADKILIAAGAWCNDPLTLLGLAMPLYPVKGQLALLPNFHGTRTMLHGGERFYLIPRGDKLVAGATTEPRVWEDGFDEKGERHLGTELARFFPGIKPEWVETWSGLRPRSADRLPLFGWVDEASGVAIATGLYKSGISLAPLAARTLSALLNGEKPPVDLRPFAPWRAGGLSAL
jgi:glycine oxidase